MMATLPFTVASFNQFLNEKKLMASRCPQCDALYLPPRALCCLLIKRELCMS